MYSTSDLITVCTYMTCIANYNYMIRKMLIRYPAMMMTCQCLLKQNNL